MKLQMKTKEERHYAKLLRKGKLINLEKMVGSEITVVFLDGNKANYIVGRTPDLDSELSLFERFNYEYGDTGEEIPGDKGIHVRPINDNLKFFNVGKNKYVVGGKGGWGGYIISKYGKITPGKVSGPNKDYLVLDNYLKSMGF